MVYCLLPVQFDGLNTKILHGTENGLDTASAENISIRLLYLQMDEEWES